MNYNYLIISNFVILNLFIIIFINKLIGLFKIYDFPNETRKFHKKKTSLFGGTIILINILLFFIIDFYFNKSFVDNINYNQIIIGIILFYFLGLVDDIKDLNSNIKFVLSLLILIIIIKLDENILVDKIFINSFDIKIHLGNYSLIFTTICILIFINAFNMFDGMNLQSGSYSLMILLSLFIYSLDHLFLGVLTVSLITFLYLNYKSIVFLGNSGSHLLGFTISYLVISSSKYSEYLILSADKIFLFMIIPGLELIRLFTTRIIKKRHPFSSDRNHIHHILLNRFNESKTLIILILLSGFPMFFAVMFDKYLHIFIFLFIIIYFLIIQKFSNNEK